MGTAQYKNAATPLRTSATALSSEVYNLVLAQGAQKLSAKEKF